MFAVFALKSRYYFTPKRVTCSIGEVNTTPYLGSGSFGICGVGTGVGTIVVAVGAAGGGIEVGVGGTIVGVGGLIVGTKTGDAVAVGVTVGSI